MEIALLLATAILQSENLTYIQASSYTEKFGDFELAPHLEASLRYAPFGFQMRKTVTQNVYTMSLHKLFTMLLLTQARPLQKTNGYIFVANVTLKPPLCKGRWRGLP